MMGLLHFVLLQLMMIEVFGGYPNRKDHMGREHLTLQIHMGTHVRDIELKRINPILANEFLPVWITTDRGNEEFEKLITMDEVGEFTMYQDDCSKSAFVYYHKWRKLYGLIDVTYHIKGFPIDETKHVHVIDFKHLHHAITTEDELISRFTRSIENTTSRIRTRRNPKLKIYPELLIAISNDLYLTIEEDSQLSPGIATVIHMVTVYNAVDMLYRLFQPIDIRINIAGIVIEGMPNQWGMVSKREDLRPYIDVRSAHTKISEYFWLKQNYLPRHSYDIIIYETRKFLEDDTEDFIAGEADTRVTYEYLFPPNSYKDRLNVLILDFPTYQHFETIAHELAHIFGAEHDGVGKYRHIFDVKSCGETIMMTNECRKSCLKWGPQTVAEFTEYFSEPAHCYMKNFPRSLDVPKPKLIFSEKEQCECYGYSSSLGPGENIHENECNRPLICIDEYDDRVNVPLPMDGTPCGFNKVCWNDECVEYDGGN